MKREIKFRGKRLDNGEWVVGDYFKKIIIRGSTEMLVHYIGWQIIDGGVTWNEYEEVDPETVGEYTGLQDENGIDIFEGDILLRKCYNPNYNTQGKIVEYKSQVYYSATTNPCGWRIKNSTRTGGWSAPLSWSKLYNNKAVVVGNIHDNPELLKIK